LSIEIKDKITYKELVKLTPFYKKDLKRVEDERYLPHEKKRRTEYLTNCPGKKIKTGKKRCV
jgi:hypothetical protein